MNVAVLNTDSAELALVQRLFDLSNSPGTSEAELAQLDALVYGRMATAYGVAPADGEPTRIAA